MAAFTEEKYPSEIEFIIAPPPFEFLNENYSGRPKKSTIQSEIKFSSSVEVGQTYLKIVKILFKILFKIFKKFIQNLLKIYLKFLQK